MSTPPERSYIAIGLMSGTSADGVEAISFALLARETLLGNITPGKNYLSMV